MPKPLIYRFVTAVLLVLYLAGCATTLPPSYEMDRGQDAGLTGTVLAVAAGYGTVVAATSEGLYRKDQSGWQDLPVPGLSSPEAVTSLALVEDVLLVGTSDDGLRILSGEEWEIRNVRYGGLPDDHVTAIAAEMTATAGLAGDSLYVATRGGLAVRRDGRWSEYTPDGAWLEDLAGDGDPGDIYMTPGFRFGGRVDVRKAFTPEVTAIGIGEGIVVLGGSGGQLAILRNGSFAALRIEEVGEVVSLLVDENSIWCGADTGLFWGGLYGSHAGKPYPRWRVGQGSSGTLFGSRDSRPFHYFWYRFGYNSARVTGLSRDGSDGLWVLFSARESAADPAADIAGPAESRGTFRRQPEPVTGIRRYVSVDAYLQSGERPYYESYGRSFGVRGWPAAVAYDGVSDTVWLGTSTELAGLRGR